MTELQLLLGLALLAGGGFVFARLEGAMLKYPSLRAIPALDALVVALVLGSWTAGLGLSVRSLDSITGLLGWLLPAP